MPNNKPSAPVQMKISLDQLPTVPCKCGGIYFAQAFELCYASAIQSPNGQPALINKNKGFACIECGLINEVDMSKVPGAIITDPVEGDQP